MTSPSQDEPSAPLPLQIHSSHFPCHEDCVSTFPGSFEDFTAIPAHWTAHSQPQTPYEAKQQQQRVPKTSVDDLSDADGSTLGHWDQIQSTRSLPCVEDPMGRHPTPSAQMSVFSAPLLIAGKDARLACRQHLEEAYTSLCASETSGDSGPPQKKELRLEGSTTDSLLEYPPVRSPAYARSAGTAESVDSACADRHNLSFFSANSVRDTFDTLGTSISQRANTLAPNNFVIADADVAQIGTQGDSLPVTSLSTALTESSVGCRSATTTMECSGRFSASRLSKCKRRLQDLTAPAFDLKAVQEAQPCFLDALPCSAAQTFPMTNINALLAVGSWKDAFDTALLKAHNIRYVLNVAKEVMPMEDGDGSVQGNDIISEWIPMSDSHAQDVCEHFLKAFRFIERARRNQSRVLVHCRRGISRSAAIVVGYIMASEHRSYEDALSFVTERRSCVSLNLAFHERLSEFVPTDEFFHGRLSEEQDIEQQPNADFPSSTSSSTGVLPTLLNVASRSEDAQSSQSSNSFRSQPEGQLGYTQQEPPQLHGCHSASRSSTCSCASGRVSGVSSQRFETRAQPPSSCCPALSTAALTSSTSTPAKATPIKESSAGEALPNRHPCSSPCRTFPRASAAPIRARRAWAWPAETHSLSRLARDEDEEAFCPHPEMSSNSVYEEGREDATAELGSPHCVHRQRTPARFSCSRGNGNSLSGPFWKRSPHHHSEERDVPATVATATMAANSRTTALEDIDEPDEVEQDAATDEEVGEGEEPPSSGGVSTSEVFLHRHHRHSGRATVRENCALDDISDDNRGEVPEPTTDGGEQSSKQRVFHESVRSAFATQQPSPLISEEDGNGRVNRRAFLASMSISCLSTSGGGNTIGTTATKGGLSIRYYGKRKALSDEKLTPSSSSVSQTSPLAMEVISRSSSFGG